MVKIVMDSGGDLTPDMRNKKDMNIEMIPLNLQLGDDLYIDDLNLDVGAYLDAMDSYPDIPKTSAPSPEKYMEAYKGPESTFAVTLSSHLSGSFNSAVLARQMYVDEIGHKFIHVFDSLSASVGEMVIALKINEFARKNLPDHEIVESVNKFIGNMKTYFILEKYDNLVRTGRMNGYVAKLATFLNIKAICAGIEGKTQFLDKARGYDRAIVKLVDRIALDDDLENRILGISHIKCLDRALTLKEEVVKRLKFKDIIITEANGLSTTYAQRGGIILAY